MMVDFASTQARAKEVAPPAIHEGGKMGAAATKPQSTSPPLTTDGVDKMYLQLAEIYTIATTQPVECTRWHRSDPATSLVQAGAGRQRPTTTPSAVVLHRHPLRISHPGPRYGGRASV
jgi:hypothetical protein